MWSRYVASQVKHNSYFVVGMALGLWVSLAAVGLEDEGPVCAAPTTAADEWAPRLVSRPEAPHVAPRSLQRPRYYTTELNMRGSVVVGVLSSGAALEAQVPALNRTLRPLQPAVKFFITAHESRAAPPLPNVVGFTDTREMLKPFHALKYLADNFLEEYDFFFLVTDETFVHARRLAELVARLSAGRALQLGTPEPGEPYCSLDAGVLLSNAVLRAVHAELEWCVRNSYSPRHHENVGRCVLHAAHAPCAATAQGQAYTSLELRDGEPPGKALAGAVTVRGARDPDALARLHALAARVRLGAAKAEAARARSQLTRTAARHPPGYRNASWPVGLRADPGLAPPPPADRHSHARWTAFNATHALMPEEGLAAGELRGSWARALGDLRAEVDAWARARWPGAATALLEGAWRWEAPTGLRYRLLLRLTPPDGRTTLKQVEAMRPLGGARLVPVPYVTESARVVLVLGVPVPEGLDAGRAFLARAEPVLARDGNAALHAFAVGGDDAACAPLRREAEALASRRPPGGAAFARLDADAPPDEPEGAALVRAGAAALLEAARRLPPDALLLLVPPHLEFNEDFLNRARMNAIRGEQWFAPLPFARHALYEHPRFVTADGARPTTGTGRFRRATTPLLAAYAADVLAAGGAPRRLRAIRAPEPGAVLRVRSPPCAVRSGACLRALGAPERELELGARGALARLLLEVQSEA